MGIVSSDTAVFGFVLLKCGFRDAMTTANIRCLLPGFLLPGHPDDLLFREP
ncbi:hypothetical protein ABIE64_003955 [Thalassospira sp. MBR-102]|jgi:hypothetical protein|nr:hypothetical protein KO164_4128 [Thalassospira sp. KO164]PXX27994.1 hypothetical protein C7967_111108 [Thalassospira sp. 11-3]|tara:strand:- start:708 stop:860 length:153 start_codon:yes stop_codon:yes gene_type:complete